LSSTGATREVANEQILWITWVPLVEEIVFRVGIGNWFRRRTSPFVGTYFAIVTFSLVHSLPTLENMTQFNISTPLGPLVLAMFCEALYILSGKVWPAIALHSACNATVVVFSLVDARWLDWLGLLYL
jgi:membrane protease YdiL (CAAX protease family)